MMEVQPAVACGPYTAGALALALFHFQANAQLP
jgi:hypothetical protein